MYLKGVFAYEKYWRIFNHLYWRDNVHMSGKHGVDGKKIIVLECVRPGERQRVL